MADRKYYIVDTTLTHDNGKVKLQGNWIGYQAVSGLKIPFKCVLSKYYIHQEQRTGDSQALRSGKLNLTRCWINLFNSGGFSVKVKDENSKAESSYHFTTRNQGTLNSQLGLIPLDESGKKYDFSVIGDSDNMRLTITSDEPSPLCITGTGFRGDYINDARDV